MSETRTPFIVLGLGLGAVMLTAGLCAGGLAWTLMPSPPPPDLIATLDADLRPAMELPEQDLARAYDAACAADYEPACHWREWQGDPEHELERALSFFPDSCQRGADPNACVLQAWRELQLLPTDERLALDGMLWTSFGDPQRAERVQSGRVEAQRLLELACDDGAAPSACVELGRAYGWALSGKQDIHRAEALWTDACVAGAPRGCNDLGDLYYPGSPRDDRVRALELFEQACQLGDLEGCRNAASMNEDEDVKQRLLTDVCERGDMLACSTVGGRLIVSDDSEQQSRGVAMLTRACDQGLLVACTHLGYAHELSVAPSPSPGTAMELYGRACQGGTSIGCEYLGDAHDEGLSGSRDQLAAREAYELACAGGRLESCLTAAKLFEDEALGASPEHALELMQQGCSLGDGQSCNFAGLRSEEADIYASARLYTESCELGWDWGCINRAVLQSKGRGMEPDAPAALRTLLGYCEVDEPYRFACRMAGLTLTKDYPGVPIDYPRARGLYETACELEDATACNNLGWLHFNGHGTRADQVKGRRLYQRACELGSDMGCKNAEWQED